MGFHVDMWLVVGTQCGREHRVICNKDVNWMLKTAGSSGFGVRDGFPTQGVHHRIKIVSQTCKVKHTWMWR